MLFYGEDGRLLAKERVLRQRTPFGQRSRYGKGKKGMWKGKMSKASGWPVSQEEGEEEAAPTPGPLDIKLTLVQAENLRKADVTGTSDPFVECFVAGEEKPFFVSKVQKKTVNPEWNQETEFQGFDEGRKLEFIVKDQDLGGASADLLGRAAVKYSDIFPNGFEGP